MGVVKRIGAGAYVGAGAWVGNGERLPWVPHLAPLNFYLFWNLIFKLGGQFV